MKTLLTVPLICLATFFVVWCLAQLATRATGVPDGFPPFTALPLLSGVLGGFVGASAVYALVRAMATTPDRTFFFIALGLLALSPGLPLRLSFTHSQRFAGVTPSAQMTLALLHTVVATAVVAALTRTGAILP